MRHLLQNATFITNCDSTVRLFNCVFIDFKKNFAQGSFSIKSKKIDHKIESDVLASDSLQKKIKTSVYVL